MKRKIFMVGFVFLIIVNIAAISRISYRRIEHYCKFRRTENCERQHFLQRKLELSENQTVEMQRLTQQLSTEIDSMKSSLYKSQKEMIELFHESAIDTLKLREISVKIDLLQSKMRNQVIDYIIEQKKILSHEQQNLFIDLLSQYLLPEQNCNLSDSLKPK